MPKKARPEGKFSSTSDSQIIHGDCVEIMRGMDEAGVDAIVTDPPYGLGFMDKWWDALPPGDKFAYEALRVLKPGGHILAFGGTRTYHRLTCALEDAGFEIRDCLAWLYGTGFPKSLDVSKAIDRANGVAREDKFGGSFERRSGPTGNKRCEACGKWLVSGSPCRCPRPQDAPQTEDARRWQGWGTALKPAFEPIVLARKPLLERTVAANVLAYGTGALNIDKTRIGVSKGVPASPRRVPQGPAYGELGKDPGTGSGWDPNIGRWPTNVVLDEEAARMLDEQAGERKTSRPGTTAKVPKFDGDIYNASSTPQIEWGYGDTGGASRFFYCAKASRRERTNNGTVENDHPTVKPIALMRWLCCLITPPGGLVLDPFVGSGTTGIAAREEGFQFIGIEKDPHYVLIARKRLGESLK